MCNTKQELRNEFTELIGEVRVKNLFTGYGIFQEDAMFALSQNDAIFVRAEGELVPYLERLGCCRSRILGNVTAKSGNLEKSVISHFKRILTANFEKRKRPLN